MMKPQAHATRSRIMGRRQTLRLAAGGGIVAALALAAPSRATAARPLIGDPAFTPAELAALDAIIARYTALGTNPGVVAGAWVAGRGAWVRVVGVGDLSTGAPITAADVFRIASNTKTFVGTAVLQLVDEGRLTLADRLDRFIPGIANGDQITTRQLLNMTAGVYSFTEDEAFLAAYEADPLLPFGPEDVLAIVRRHEPYFAPGAGFHYSDSQTILLGLIVEQITGRPLPEVVERRVVAPLGLTGTSFPTTPSMPSPYAHGYRGGGASGPRLDFTRSNPNVAGAAGAMLSTLQDMRVWAKALADGAQLRPETQRERLTWTTIISTPLVLRYGLGIADFNGFLGHNGGIFGYSTIAVHMPAADATIVVLVNRGELEGGDADPIFYAIAGVLFPDRFRR